MNKNPINLAIDLILLPEFSKIGFRKYRNRGIYRINDGLLQLVYLDKLRSKWHRVFYGSIPLFEPEVDIAFGEPGGNITKQVSGANIEASERSMKAILPELNEIVFPVFERTFTVNGYCDYLENYIVNTDIITYYCYRLALAYAKIEDYNQALKLISKSNSNNEFLENRVHTLKKEIEEGSIKQFLIETENKNKINLKF